MPSSLDLEMNGSNQDQDHPAPAEPLLTAPSGRTSDDSLNPGLPDDHKDFQMILKGVCPAEIASLTVQIPSSNKGSISTNGRTTNTNSPGKAKPTPKPSRWNTREFYCYYIIIAVYLLLMIRTTIRLSNGEWRYTTRHTTPHYKTRSWLRWLVKVRS